MKTYVAFWEDLAPDAEVRISDVLTPPSEQASLSRRLASACLPHGG